MSAYTNNRRYLVCFLGTLFAIQALCLLYYFVVDIAPFPPEASDQALYLEQTYDLADRGIHAIIANTISAGAQGALFFSEGAILETIFRLPRFSAILLNYMALLMVEAALFLTVRHITQSLALALLSVGLFLSTHTLWFWAGGLFDFRIDWLAACAYGVWCCVVLRSGVFENRKWTIVAFLASIFLILNRYVTVTYVLGIEFPLLIIVGAYESIYTRLRRTYLLLVSIVAQFLILTPFAYNNWEAISRYYVVGHLTGNEKQIRAQEFGVTDLATNLMYYPASIFRDHLGTLFFGMVLVLPIIWGLIIILEVLTNTAQRRARPNIILAAFEAIFLLGAILAPITILTVDLSKSPVVGGIVDVPVILLIIFSFRWAGLGFILKPDSIIPAEFGIATIVGSLFLCVGLIIEIHYGIVTRRIAQRTDLQKWDLSVQSVVLDAVSEHNSSPRIVANALSPHSIPPVYSAVAREMGYAGVHFNLGYDQSIFAPQLDEFFSALRSADYVVLSDAPASTVYPISAFFAQHDSTIRAWVATNMDKLVELNYDGSLNQVYKRRPDFVQNWISGSYGQEQIEGRVFQWETVFSTLKVSKATVPCMTLSLFAMGPGQQSVRIESNLGSSRVIDLAGTDIWHVRKVVLPLPARDKDVIFTFSALQPAGHFPNDSKEIAFGADQALAATCSSP